MRLLPRLISVVSTFAVFSIGGGCSAPTSPVAPTAWNASSIANVTRRHSSADAQIFISAWEPQCPTLRCVEGFTKTGEYVDTLSGVYYPDGLTFDKQGNLYVADPWLSYVAVYPPGATSPSRTIVDPDPGGPYEVALDAAGDVWVTNGITWSHHFKRRDDSENIMEFGHQGYLMEVVTCPHVTEYDGGLVVDKGNVFFQGYLRKSRRSYVTVVEEIPAGKFGCKQLPMRRLHDSWGGLALTNAGDLLVGDSYTHEVRTYAAPSYSQVIARTNFREEGVRDLSAFALTKDNHEIWIANNNAYPTVALYRYPDARKTLVTMAPTRTQAVAIAINY
jgi:hypothetical protein